MAKAKTWLVTLKPPKDRAPKLTIRPGDTGAKRTAVRNYHLQAGSRAEAQSLVEEQERLIAGADFDAVWIVESVESV